MDSTYKNIEGFGRGGIRHVYEFIKYIFDVKNERIY